MAKLFNTGGEFPEPSSIERLAKYERGRILFKNKIESMRERALQLFKDNDRMEQYEQLKSLLIAVALPDILVTKPADLMVGEPPIISTGKSDKSDVQKAVNKITEENGLNKLIHEIVVGAGYRGDAFLKVRYNYRQDFSELPDEVIPEGRSAPEGVMPEPIIEAIDPSYVFPETSSMNRKQFKAINIAFIEWMDEGKEEIPYLSVERHIPGYIMYDRFRLNKNGVNSEYGSSISTYKIGERMSTGRDNDIEFTGVMRPLIFHCPYKTTDDEWQGISGIEKMESLFDALNERLVQIDYILYKHSDPNMYGPDLETNAKTLGTGGMYITVAEKDKEPGYMDWNAQLDSAFKELDKITGFIFQVSETPQWIFGTVVADNGSDGGTGTSHTDGAAIEARFMPLLKKVERIRVHVDKAIKDALFAAMELEVQQNEGVEGFSSYEPVYPKIKWRNGLPKNKKEVAETMSIRTGGKPTIDVASAIKEQDGGDDYYAEKIKKAIEKDEEDANSFVEASIFNDEQPKTEEEGDS
ncbi:phage portal protein [Mechercharimyces sp. CAU 1602]|uniref:phage portal protein n=1 Tax=Mechercharimyces sp. CAU 1602 TaxID=2973933 RepID=UPI0021612F82|nr:phage portal protein [Mechercharimyces sp. CAU 1602]MCS1350313.1 phage portal protein [Mechercharimyces sp. CAU 1602]